MAMVLVQARIQCIMINITTTIINAQQRQCTIMAMVLVQATIQCIMINITTTIIHQCTIMAMVLVQATIQCIMINITTNTTSLVPVTVVHLVHTPSSITVPYQAVIVDRNVMMMLIALFMLPYRTVIMSIAQHIQNAILSKHITVELSGVVHFLEKSNQIQGIHQCTIMVM